MIVRLKNLFFVQSGHFRLDLKDSTTPYNKNIHGKLFLFFELCKKFISGRRGANTNFVRHYEQVL